MLSSIPTASPPAMLRSATLAIVVSSTSMKVAIETTIGDQIGIVPAGRRPFRRPAARGGVRHRTLAQGTTDMPGPIGMSAGQLSISILTGTRCTTLT